MNRKGFTLVELLAVIAILAILVIIALPNVMGMFNTAKMNSFTTEVKEIFKQAEQAWISDSLFNTEDQVYVRTKNANCSKSLDLTGRKELEYYIKVNKSGQVVEYYASDGTYQYSYSGSGLKIEDIVSVIQISNITDASQIISISCSEVENGTTNNTYPARRYVYYNSPLDINLFFADFPGTLNQNKMKSNYEDFLLDANNPYPIIMRFGIVDYNGSGECIESFSIGKYNGSSINFIQLYYIYGDYMVPNATLQEVESFLSSNYNNCTSNLTYVCHPDNGCETSNGYSYTCSNNNKALYDCVEADAGNTRCLNGVLKNLTIYDAGLKCELTYNENGPNYGKIIKCINYLY